MSFAGEAVSAFVAPDGSMRYSVRRRADGFFQIVHDGATLDDGSQPDWMENRILSGIFADAELAEIELIHLIDDAWTKAVQPKPMSASGRTILKDGWPFCCRTRTSKNLCPT